ncbi:E3 ubiquitin-protein ligase Topors-like [Diprion similis]|uniref:E3 ubiquitin-protein ligase Topors-like n=1 Tax=Diprion similis TaxID=362088 RepID=UPI001EF9915F|nr:E3 ubiquitin-protein ligase Topors-like [Diprion similis]
MDEQIESIRAAAAAIPKGPLKTEEISQSSPENEPSERSDGTTSPPPNCSICLGKLINKSFTDSCLHQFCFSCLLEWSKIKTECPLCKQTFKSIIHNVRSEGDYDQYHVPRQFVSLSASQMAATVDVHFDLVSSMNVPREARGFSYRTTMTPNHRYRNILNPEQVMRNEQVPAVTSLVSRAERRLRRTNPIDYRRNVYRFGHWATSLPDIFGNFRECSAEYYRRNPNQLNRLIPWLNRELQVLLNNNAPQISYVMRVIMESITRYDLRSSDFRDTVRPYFAMHTEHFVHELLNYAQTSFDVIGYDQYVTYVSNRGLSNEYVPVVSSPSSSSSSISNDSDVQVVEETIDASRINIEMPGIGPHTVEMPGPSTVAEAFRETTQTSNIVLTISSSSSGISDNECEVVGYVKPRHERTPEVIDLLSSDADTVNVPDAPNLDYTEHTRHNCQVVTKQHPIFEDSIDRSLFDSPSVSTFSEVNEATTSTDRKGSSIRNTLASMKRFSHTTTSESDDLDSNRDCTPYSSSKSKNKSKKSIIATTPAHHQKYKRGTKMFVRIRRRIKAVISSSSESEGRSVQGIFKPMSTTPESDKRECSSSWSDSSPDRHKKRQKTKGKSKLLKSAISNMITIRKDLVKKEEWCSEDCAESDASQRSTSISKHRSCRNKKYGSKRYRSIKDSDSEREVKKRESDDHNSFEDNGMSSKKQTEANLKVDYSTTDSERNVLNGRSSSYCSARSSKPYVAKKKSKHKDRRKEKESRKTDGRTVAATVTDSFQADDDCTPSVSTASVTSSVRSDTLLSSRYASCKKRSSSKERRKSHRKYKESRKSHKRSKSESKSRSKKKKRRIRSSSSSNSE